MNALGIDISRLKFHVALLRENGTIKSHTFVNSEIGFEQLAEWIAKQSPSDLWTCMESTGGYGDALATFLHDRSIAVSVVNPSQIKAFANSELVRTKTDSSDAALIARFCKAQRPAAWCPPTPKERLLQSLVRRRMDLLNMRAQEATRLQAPIQTTEVHSSIEQLIGFLDTSIKEIDRQIKELIDDDPDLRNRRDLLLSIPDSVSERYRVFLERFHTSKSFVTVKPSQPTRASRRAIINQGASLGKADSRRSVTLECGTCCSFQR